MTAVLVLGGGPDAEREVSLRSAAAVAGALREGGFSVEHREIDRLTAEELADLPGDVVFPVLHGLWGEGGPLQDLLDAGGRPYVGCGRVAARLGMDKLATKLAAAAAGVRTPPAALVNPADPGCPLPFPVVVKPVHEGSSVGLHVCRDADAWAAAHAWAARRASPVLVEAMVPGRELTAAVVAGESGGLEPLPLVEITPRSGVYDFASKYTAGATVYTPRPDVPPEAEQGLRAGALAACAALGVRHVARADFMLDAAGDAWLLEVNTMPGFTATSLLPMAAASAGLPLPALCGRLVRAALAGRG